MLRLLTILGASGIVAAVIWGVVSSQDARNERAMNFDRWSTTGLRLAGPRTPSLETRIPPACVNEVMAPSSNANAVAELVRAQALRLASAQCLKNDYSKQRQAYCAKPENWGFNAVAVADRNGRLDRPIQITRGEEMPVGAAIVLPAATSIASAISNPKCDLLRYYELNCGRFKEPCSAAFIGTHFLGNWDLAFR